MSQLLCKNSPATAVREECQPVGAGSVIREKVALLTAGRDKPYALGLASAVLAAGVGFDFIGSDIVDGPELHGSSMVRFFNLRDQRADATPIAKARRILTYYGRLIAYATRS